jgi:hypothetical protein
VSSNGLPVGRVLYVRIPPDVYEEAQRVRAERGVSMVLLVSRAMQRYLEELGWQRPEVPSPLP